MSGLFGSVLGALIKGLFSAISNWIKGKKLQEAESEAKAKAAALASVGEAKVIDDKMRDAADYDKPPINPNTGQKWTHPVTGAISIWDGSKWVPEGEYATQDDSDVFGDSSFNSAP